MKTFFCSLLLAALLATPAYAQQLAGTWQGRLEAAPGKTLAIQFVITAKPGGGYSAIVTSPDDGAIKNVPAASVTFADSKLTLDVPALSGGYAGTLRNGVLDGEWSQEGKKLPLSLKPYGTVTLTRANIDTLRGDWSGKLTGPGGTVTIVLHFTTGTDGTLKGALEVPEQNVKNLEAKDIVLDDGHFSVDMPLPHAKVAGTLKGDQIVGEWSQLGMSFPLTLKKGTYVAPTYYLDLPASALEKIKGRWGGTLNGLAVIIRFETDAKGRTLGFFDSTQQNAFGLPIKEAALTGTKLTFTAVYGAKFAGELAGDKVTGEWTQTGFTQPLPLVLTREK